MQPDTRQAQTAQTVLMWAVFLVALAVIGRFVAQWPNFTPVVAVALFAGLLFRGHLVWAVPVVALVVSDLVIGFYPPGEMAFVYLGMVAAALVGRGVLRPRLSALTYVGATLGGSIIFFLLSNFGVWLFGGIYPLTVAGLMACYIAAIPFFQYTLASTALWLAILIGLHVLVARLAPRAASES